MDTPWDLVENLIDIRKLDARSWTGHLNNRLASVGYRARIYDRPPSQSYLDAKRKHWDTMYYTKVRDNGGKEPVNDRQFEVIKYNREDFWTQLSREELVRTRDQLIKTDVLIEHRGNTGKKSNELHRNSPARVVDVQFDKDGSCDVIIRPYNDYDGFHFTQLIEQQKMRGWSLHHEINGNDIHYVEVSLCHKGRRPNTWLQRVVKYNTVMHGSSKTYKYVGMLKASDVNTFRTFNVEDYGVNPNHLSLPKPRRSLQSYFSDTMATSASTSQSSVANNTAAPAAATGGMFSAIFSKQASGSADATQQQQQPGAAPGAAAAQAHAHPQPAEAVPAKQEAGEAGPKSEAPATTTTHSMQASGSSSSSAEDAELRSDEETVTYLDSKLHEVEPKVNALKASISTAPQNVKTDVIAGVNALCGLADQLAGDLQHAVSKGNSYKRKASAMEQEAKELDKRLKIAETHVRKASNNTADDLLNMAQVIAGRKIENPEAFIDAVSSAPDSLTALGYVKDLVQSSLNTRGLAVGAPALSHAASAFATDATATPPAAASAAAQEQRPAEVQMMDLDSTRKKLNSFGSSFKAKNSASGSSATQSQAAATPHAAAMSGSVPAGSQKGWSFGQSPYGTPATAQAATPAPGSAKAASFNKKASAQATPMDADMIDPMQDAAQLGDTTDFNIPMIKQGMKHPVRGL